MTVPVVLVGWIAVVVGLSIAFRSLLWRRRSMRSRASWLAGGMTVFAGGMILLGLATTPVSPAAVLIWLVVLSLAAIGMRWFIFYEFKAIHRNVVRMSPHGLPDGVSAYLDEDPSRPNHPS